MTTRYEAEWISGYNGDEDENFDPDLYEYDSTTFPTREKAEQHAEAMAKHCGCVSDWWRVTEQEWDRNYYERGMGNWKDLRAWVEGEEIRL